MNGEPVDGAEAGPLKVATNTLQDFTSANPESLPLVPREESRRARRKKIDVSLCRRAYSKVESSLGLLQNCLRGWTKQAQVWQSPFTYAPYRPPLGFCASQDGMA